MSNIKISKEIKEEPIIVYRSRLEFWLNIMYENARNRHNIKGQITAMRMVRQYAKAITQELRK